METDSGNDVNDSEVCEPCKEQMNQRPALYWCSDCRELLCESCYGHHKVLKATRNHKSLSINDYRQVADIADLETNCKYHRDKVIESICLTHSQPCCLMCKSKLHGGECVVKRKNEILRETNVHANLKHTIETTNRLLDDVEKSLPILEQSIPYLEEQSNLFYEELRRGREKVEQFLDQFEENVKRNYENMYASAQQSIDDDISILEKRKLDLVQRRETAQVVLELDKFSDLQLYLLNSKFHNENTLAQTQVESVCAYYIAAKPVFEINEELRVITLTDITDYKSENTEKEVQYTCDNLHFNAVITDAEAELENPLPKKASEKDSGQNEQVAEHIDPTIETDSRFLNQRQSQLYSLSVKNGYVGDRYYLDNSLVVNGIACDSDNIFLATLTPRTVKLDPTTKTFSTILSAQDSLSAPYSVDYCKDSDQLLVIDDGKKVRLFSKHP